jgi:hypothetical protein
MKGDQMAIVVVNKIRGGDQGFYDDVSGRTLPEGQLPDGCQLHIAGPTDEGWRVITVWDSDGQFQQFRNETLIPAIQEAGYGDRVAPSIESSEVYRLITA